MCRESHLAHGTRVCVRTHYWEQISKIRPSFHLFTQRWCSIPKVKTLLKTQSYSPNIPPSWATGPCFCLLTCFEAQWKMRQRMSLPLVLGGRCGGGGGSQTLVGEFCPLGASQVVSGPGAACRAPGGLFCILSGSCHQG